MEPTRAERACGSLAGLICETLDVPALPAHSVTSGTRRRQWGTYHEPRQFIQKAAAPEARDRACVTRSGQGQRVPFMFMVVARTRHI